MFRLATSSMDALVLEMAAKAHGHLLRVATTMMGTDLVEWDLQQALDPWMKVQMQLFHSHIIRTLLNSLY